MAKGTEQQNLGDTLSNVDDSQLDGVAGGGEVEWKDGKYYAYTVCPACGQKDFYASGWDGGLTFGVIHTCSNCGQQFKDSIRVPKKPLEPEPSQSGTTS